MGEKVKKVGQRIRIPRGEKKGRNKEGTNQKHKKLGKAYTFNTNNEKKKKWTNSRENGGVVLKRIEGEKRRRKINHT